MVAFVPVREILIRIGGSVSDPVLRSKAKLVRASL